MNYKYNAFISYRHTPIDAKIAVEIQRRLERFSVPKSLQKEIGKKITRVFRDKEELPTTSNLNDDILDALNHSEFLIVICSPNTEESIWVKREIQIFLASHPRHNVITVLAEGEPQDVIPEVLRYEERREMGEDGTERTVRVPVEPLSCDYRGSLRKARKEELPRLVATLLSVEYDQLKQRRRAYLLQRITLASFAALVLLSGFAVYAIRKNHIITRQAEQLGEEYRHTVVSQSKYFAAEAEKALEKDDYHAAIRDAVNAIPEDLEEFPVIPEAKNKLIKSLGVYGTPASVRNTMVVTGKGNMGDDASDSNIEQIFLDSEGAYLLGNNYDQIRVWDASDLEVVNDIRISTASGESGVSCVSPNTIFKNEPLIVYAADHSVFCINYLTGETIWNRELDSTAVGAALLQSDSKLAVVAEEHVYVLDAQNGQVKTNLPFHTREGYTLNEEMAVSDDGSQVAFSAEWYDADGDDYKEVSDVYLADFERQSVKVIASGLDKVGEMLFLDAGKLMVSSFYGHEFLVEGVGTRSKNCKAYLQCYDAATGEMVWENHFSYRMLNQANCLKEIQYKDRKKKRKAVMFSFANYSEIVDAENGEPLHEFEYHDSIVRLQYSEGGFASYLCNGERWWSDYTSEDMSYRRYFAGEIADLCGKDNVFFVLGSDGAIVRYEYEKVSDRYKINANIQQTAGWMYTVWNGCFCSSYIAALDETYCENWGVNVIDKSTWKTQHIALPDAIEPTEDGLLGFSEDEKQVYIDPMTDDAPSICCVDIETGEASMVPIPACSEDAGRIRELLYAKGTFLYTVELNSTVRQGDGEVTDSNRIGVCAWTPGEPSKLIADYPLYAIDGVPNQRGKDPSGSERDGGEDQQMSYRDHSLFYNADTETAGYLVNNSANEMDAAVSVNLNTGKVTEIPMELRRQEQTDSDWCQDGYTWSQSGRLFTEPYSDEIRLWDADGNRRFTIQFDREGETVCQAFFTQKQENLVLVFNTGRIVQYDTETGEKINEITLSTGYAVGNRRRIPIPEEGEGCVILWALDGCSVIDTSPDTFGECYSLEHCIDYSSDTDSFLFLTEGWIGEEDGTFEIGEIQRYTVQELREIGQKRIK